jgi:hypothetical protein
MHFNFSLRFFFLCNSPFVKSGLAFCQGVLPHDYFSCRHNRSRTESHLDRLSAWELWCSADVIRRRNSFDFVDELIIASNSSPVLNTEADKAFNFTLPIDLSIDKTTSYLMDEVD